MKIRVLEVLATLKRAGAERMAVSLVRGLDPDRFETGVVSLFDAFPSGLEPELEAARIPTWHLGKRPGLDPRMIPRLFRVFRAFRPSILHTHSYVLRYTLPAGLAARAGSMVHTVHNLAAREVDATGRLIHRFAFRRGVAPVVLAAGRPVNENSSIESRGDRFPVFREERMSAVNDCPFQPTASPRRPFSQKGSITLRQHAEASFYQWTASISPSSLGLSRPSPAARDHRCCRRVTAQSAIPPPLVGFVLAKTLNYPPIEDFTNSCSELERQAFSSGAGAWAAC